jgi:hypothetical protein
MLTEIQILWVPGNEETGVAEVRGATCNGVK